MVNVSVLQPVVWLGSQTGTSYTYSPGFVGENVYVPSGFITKVAPVGLPESGTGVP